MALVELQNRGVTKYLVSQNCDGLHRRSGIAPVRSLRCTNMSLLAPIPNSVSLSPIGQNLRASREQQPGVLQGLWEGVHPWYVTSPAPPGNLPRNLTLVTDFRAVATYHNSIHDHRTGRKCTRCGGALHDSIINFGEYLPEDHLERARFHAKKADLCLALGSSLTIPPAKDIPEAVGRRRNSELAICNLQSTPLDGLADHRVYAKTDDFMTRVMDKLGIPIPEFVLHRRLSVEFETVGDGRHQLSLCGVDVDGTPVSFLQSVSVEYSRRPARNEPFVLNFRCDMEPGASLKMELEFMGHYGEPNLELTYTHGGGQTESALYLLEYSPYVREWRTTKLKEVEVGDGVDGDMAGKKDISVILIEDSD